MKWREKIKILTRANIFAASSMDDFTASPQSARVATTYQVISLI